MPITSIPDEFFQALFDETTDGVFITDVSGHCLAANDRFTNLLGCTSQDLQQISITDLFYKEGNGREKAFSILSFAEKNEWKRQPVRGKDGEIHWVDITLRRMADGKIMGITRNVEARTPADRGMEAALRESQRQMNALITSLDDVVIEYDELGTYRNIWAANEKLLAQPAQEMLGRRVRDVLGEDAGRSFEEAIQRVLQSGQPENMEYSLQVIGGLRWFLGRVNPIVPADGEPRTVALLVRDITKRKQAEDALSARTEELEALFSVSTHLRKAQTVETMLPLVLEEVCRVLAADGGAAILLEPDESHFRVALANGPLEHYSGSRFNAGLGICGEIFRTRRPHIFDDLASGPLKLTGSAGDEQLGPSVLVPLQSETQFLGILSASRLKRPEAQPFSSGTMQLLGTIGEMVSTALSRLRLLEEAQRRLSEVQALREIDLAIIGSADLRISVRTILDNVRSQMSIDAACVLVLNPYTLELEFTAGQGFRSKVIARMPVRLGEGYAGRAAMERRTIHVPDLRRRGTDIMRMPIFQEETFVSYYAVPLLAKGQVKGVLEVFQRSPLEPGAEWVDFLETLAGQAAIAIDNAGLFADLQRSNQELVLAYDATIEGWSRALDLRDKETEGHTQRVTEMTLRLARAMGMGEAELLQVRRGALLHDIGKMGIPDTILLKPGELSETEWVIMRRHPAYAYEMLSPISYLRPALDIPYCHHEKWDGSGYPRGLKGEGIPLAARIFAVIDVWDALTSDRPYRPAWPEAKARLNIREQSGKHFDPKVVDVFLRTIMNIQQPPAHQRWGGPSPAARVGE